FAEEEIADRLTHQPSSRQADEDGNRVDALADEGDGVRDRNRAVDFGGIVITFLPQPHLERRRKLAAVVEQIDLQKQERYAHVEVAGNLQLLSAAILQRRGLDRDQMHFLVPDLRAERPAVHIDEEAVRYADLHRPHRTAHAAREHEDQRENAADDEAPRPT